MTRSRFVLLAALSVLATAGAACLAGSLSKPTPSTCRPCVANVDCVNEFCAQLADDAVCARACASNTDCAEGDTCADLIGSEGGALKACVARDGQCGPIPTASPAETVDPACVKYQLPDVAGTCCSCSPGKTCAPNNCYGGWTCDSSSCRCAPLPTTCGPPPSSTVEALKTGGAVTANVTTKGGTMNRLHFAVVGDTRPAVLNDTAHYPTEIVKQIYTDIERASPRPAFVVTTGDYVFSTPKSNTASAQMDQYLIGRALFSGPMFPALGNHECDGYTSSNCGPGIGMGVTSNYRAFVDKLLAPIGESKSYYVRRIDATDGSWTSKFVVVAPNSWNNTQATWLEEALSVDTTYTFLVRHEPTTMGGEASTPAPGVAPSEAIVQKYPLTLALEGHAHTWLRPRNTKEVIIGNGGAPMTTTVPFGFTVISQRADGAIVVTNYDSTTERALFTFAVKADGSNAP